MMQTLKQNYHSGLSFHIVGVAAAALFCSASLWAASGYVGERNTFNRFHGKGTYTYNNGNVYSGNWQDGRKSGTGVQTWHNGDRYEGQWSANYQNGLGTMKWANGNQYEGQWAGGQRHGLGTMRWANGNRYQGNWRSDKREGEGKQAYADGKVYQGQWVAGKRQGKGALILKNGTRLEGKWKVGRLLGKVQFSFPNGDQFIGQASGFKPHGSGVCITDGERADCRYVKGKLKQSKQNQKIAKAAAATKEKQAAAAAMQLAARKARQAERAAEALAAKKSAQREASRRAAERRAEERRIARLQAAEQARAKAAAQAAQAKRAAQQRKAALAAAAAKASAATGKASVQLVGQKNKSLSFQHGFKNSKLGKLQKAWIEQDVNQVGDLKIRAEGDYALVLMIDEYFGPGEYKLGYFKASVTRPGVESFQTHGSKPGKVVITREQNNLISGTFEFVGYPHGDTKSAGVSVYNGQFRLPLE